MATKYKLQDVSHLNGRDIFFDANVLIYLFWPTGQHFFEKNYARVFRNLLRQGNNLFVDFLVISEIINRIERIEHKKSNPTIEFKTFRDSQDGKDVVNDIYIIVENEILKRFNIIGRTFDKQDIQNYLVVDELDFVDKAIVSLCKENMLVLLTNDKDFRNTDIDVLSGNPKLLN